MSTETVKVFEEKKKGLPIWAWLIPLLLLLALAIWFFSRRPDTTTSTAAAPIADQTKPDNGAAATTAATTGATAGATTAWTTASIADAIRSKGRVGFDDNAVHFATGSATLAGDSQAVLDQTAEVLKSNPDWKMRVTGYTDSVGSDAANQQLSEQRATSVMGYLSAHGIDKSRLSVAAKGDSQPVSTNSNDTGRAQNRRVELVKQ